jgi:hypothetical protein
MRLARAMHAVASCHDVKQRRTYSSCPALAGKGDRLAQQGGGRGVGRNDTLATTAERRVRRPLHHASHGPPPPLARGRKGKKKRRKRNADRRRLYGPHQRVRGAPRSDRLAPTLRCGRARLSAFHCRLCRRDFHPWRAAPGQASWDLAGAPLPFTPPFGRQKRRSFKRALPAPPVPVQSMHPTDRS